MSIDYLSVKIIHQSAVALSFTGFFVRGIASLRGAAWVRGRAARSLPHAIDSVLLLSAIWLAWTLRLTPVAAPWLSAKIIGLVVYITLGVLALRPGLPRPLRVAAWIAALASFGWIVSVAISKNPLGLFARWVS